MMRAQNDLYQDHHPIFNDPPPPSVASLGWSAHHWQPSVTSVLLLVMGSLSICQQQWPSGNLDQFLTRL